MSKKHLFSFILNTVIKIENHKLHIYTHSQKQLNKILN